jgi:VWFA-related protein
MVTLRGAARPILAALLLLLAAALLSTSSRAAPFPAPPSDGTPRRVATAERVQVNMVLIDVVVRDGKGNPVPGLTRDAFELLVDRLQVEPDAIESFEEVCAGATTAEAPAASPDAAAAAAGPDEPPPQARHIVVVFDFSHLTLSGRRQSLRAARDWLSREPAAEDRIMLLMFKRQLHLVQDFTSSSSLLVARIDDMLLDTGSLDGEVLEEGSNLIDVGRVLCDGEGVAAMDRTGELEGLGVPAAWKDSAGATCIARRSRATMHAVEEEARGRRALKALEDLMPALSSLRGRKALVLFSDVLRDEPGIQYTALAGATPQSLGIELKEDILRLTREANAAGVALYTVHAGGLDDAMQAMFAARTGLEAHDVPAVRDAMSSAARSGLSAALSLQATLAAETGGRAVQRTNDLGRVLAVAREDLSCHYLLGYRHPGRGDNQRHSLIVRLRPGASGRVARHEVRHRPYYIDHAPSRRRDRLVRSALDVPGLHPAVPLSLEAFALAPTSRGRRVLLKATVPMNSLALLPAGDGRREGRVRVRSEIAGKGSTVCAHDTELPVSVPSPSGAAPAAERLVYETECDLPPGTYDLSLAVMDLTTQDTGGRRVPLVVPAPPPGREPLVSDVHLWVRDPAAILVTSDASGPGLENLTAGGQAGAFVPLARRTLSIGQAAMLSVLVCPRSGARVDADHPVRARRTLRGEAGATVADFRDLLLTEPPDPATGCWQLMHQIPAGTLGPGVYTFSLQALGEAIGAPLVREVDLAVE